MIALAAALGFAGQMSTWEQARTEHELTTARYRTRRQRRIPARLPATKLALLAQHARALGIPTRRVAVAGDSPGDILMLRAARTSIYVGATVPGGFTPTWHLPQAPIDEITRVILALGSPDAPPASQ